MIALIWVFSQVNNNLQPTTSDYTVQGQGQGPTPYAYISIKFDSNQNHSGKDFYFPKKRGFTRAILIWVKFDWDIRVWGRPLALPLDSVSVPTPAFANNGVACGYQTYIFIEALTLTLTRLAGLPPRSVKLSWVTILWSIFRLSFRVQ